MSNKGLVNTKKKSFSRTFGTYFIRFMLFYGLMLIVNLGLEFTLHDVLILSNHGITKGEVIGLTTYVYHYNGGTTTLRDHGKVKFLDANGATYLADGDFDHGYVSNGEMVEVNYFKNNPTISEVGNVKNSVGVGLVVLALSLLSYFYILKHTSFRK